LSVREFMQRDVKRTVQTQPTVISCPDHIGSNKREKSLQANDELSQGWNISGCLAVNVGFGVSRK